jgi:hypothetical protein
MEEFVNKIKSCWKSYDSSSRESALIQFQKNMKEAKKVATQWAKDKKQKDDKLLRELEEGLETLYNSEGFGYLNEAQKMEVKKKKVIGRKKEELITRKRERMEDQEKSHMASSR